ncbi:N-acetylmannosamine-6-phosphate 2-epimerase [Micrococcus luteus]|uniref:N-acetylmannosamine-6-phosphate 2-epimerase n=1 Tax=Micrococcus luteus TaxID=1270 RepID=UPI0011A33C66|nr:putative N-acetylmannosamine-6-phosphate 2-epimerase [Micrococcus luteus]MCV7488142.1 putative N-acetylmannosamine-6-phosphate 2-epimerase [Micrococcus luteus]MCV7701833.1 putative N-acetylmannosamine-6-phosphate 2-epimerase [Micrococcus luteus]
MSTQLIDALTGRLVVSCQAYPGEPLRDPDVTGRMCAAVVAGGAAAVRVQGVDDIAAARRAVDVPVIGLWKDGAEDVFITPSVDHALACARAGAHVVAVDGTRRPRPDGSVFADVVGPLHEVGALVMADCDTVESAVAAVAAGADLVGTTLAGYTADRPRTSGPDLALLEAVVRELPGVPVVAEGRVHRPDDAAAAMRAGAHAVVVGTAITHPTTLTRWFADAVAAGSRREAEAR